MMISHLTEGQAMAMGIMEAAIRQAEEAYHETGQRNALGSYIGCTGPVCSARVATIKSDNVGLKIQSA